MKPNLFNYATSELSQDAVLCWLLSWASPTNAGTSQQLHAVGKSVLELIYSKCGVSSRPALASVEVRKQVAGIDIVCLVDEKTAIIIEDKCGTIQHSDQLARYKAYALETLGHLPENLLLVYLQTGDQSSYVEVEKHGFRVITRASILTVLESNEAREARSASDILDDFSTYLRRVEDDVQSFQHLPFDQWSWNAWKGFYTSLQTALGAGDWGYVANPAGGFLGFWWHFHEAQGCEVYLQLEQEKFCFKIYVEMREARWNLRRKWHERVTVACPSRGLQARRPARFGSGDYMTVAILDGEYRRADASGILDLHATIQALMAAQSVVDDCVEAASQVEV